jgi:hypothetical protein
MISMCERERQTQFLKGLLKDGTEESKRLKAQITQAEHNERCIQRALILMVLVAVFSIMGLGYCAVLLPGFFDNATPLLVKLFCALGLGSLICMLIFGSCWLWYRKASNQVNEECRYFIARQLNQGGPKLDFHDEQPKESAALYQIGTSENLAESRIIRFPRAS